MSMLLRRMAEIRRYPSAIAGLILISGLVILSAYTLITLPYDEAINLWRGEKTSGSKTRETPPPHGTTSCRGSICRRRQSSTPKNGLRAKRSPFLDGLKEVVIALPVDFRFDGFPQEVSLFFESRYTSAEPYISVSWHTPDGRVVPAPIRASKARTPSGFHQDSRLRRRLSNLPPEIGLFADPATAADPKPLKGEYQLVDRGAPL